MIYLKAKYNGKIHSISWLNYEKNMIMLCNEKREGHFTARLDEITEFLIPPKKK